MEKKAKECLRRAKGRASSRALKRKLRELRSQTNAVACATLR